MGFLKKLTRTLLRAFMPEKSKKKRKKTGPAKKKTVRNYGGRKVASSRRILKPVKRIPPKLIKAAVPKPAKGKKLSAAVVPSKTRSVKVSSKLPSPIPKSRKMVSVPKMKDAPALEGLLVGYVTHYFPHVKAAALVIKKGSLRVGDTLWFKGHTTNFKEKIISMQINRQPVEIAQTGDEIGIRVKKRVRESDEVFKI